MIASKDAMEQKNNCLVFDSSFGDGRNNNIFVPTVIYVNMRSCCDKRTHQDIPVFPISFKFYSLLATRYTC